MLRPLLCLALPAAALAQSILPPPPTPSGNPTTPDKVLLGKALFWDEQLSSSRSVACGTCHVFSQGGADPRTARSVHPGPDGAFGTADDSHGSPGVARHDANRQLAGDPAFGVQPQVTPRRAPSVVNAAYAQSLFLDGRADDVFRDPLTGAVLLPSGAALEHQIAGPPVSDVEMGHVGRTWADIALELGPLPPLALATQVPAPLQQFVAGRTYDQLFAQVYGTPGVTPARIVMAIAAYERTLVSDRSPFDLFLAGQGTLNPMQQLGLQRFQTFCAGCHTDLAATVLTIGPVLADFRNIGVRPPAEDAGRMRVTQSFADRGKFRVPGLRNVALRGGFFHNGSANTLAEVVDFYARGGDFADNRDPLVAAISGHVFISDNLQLQALLGALTDPRVAQELPPFDRPRLWSEGPLAPHPLGTGAPGTLNLPPRLGTLGPAYLGSDVFGVGVDHLAPGLFSVLMVDLFGSTTPTPILGHELYLAWSSTLLFLPIGFSQDLGNGQGFTARTFHVPPSQVAPGTYWLQWVALDPRGPLGLVSSNALPLAVR
jgi:cytochrome c peroxidase